MKKLKLIEFAPHEYRPDGEGIFYIRNHKEIQVNGEIYVNNDLKYYQFNLADYFGKNINLKSLTNINSSENDDIMYLIYIENQEIRWSCEILSEFTPFLKYDLKIHNLSNYKFNYLNQCFDEYSTNEIANMYLNLYNMNIIDNKMIRINKRDVNYNEQIDRSIWFYLYSYGYNNYLTFNISLKTLIECDASKLTKSQINQLQIKFNDLIPKSFYDCTMNDYEKNCMALNFINHKIKTK